MTKRKTLVEERCRFWKECLERRVVSSWLCASWYSKIQ
jgi:hypothetical protein